MKRTDEIQPSSIRVPPDVKEAFTRRAEAEGRTFSQHVIWLMRKHNDETPEPRRKSR